jgi:hypothetical protein
MSVLPVALFLWQRDRFSCRDAHAFNRFLSLQVLMSVKSSRFIRLYDKILAFLSPLFLSSLALPRTVLLAFIEGIWPTPTVGFDPGINHNPIKSVGWLSVRSSAVICLA